MSEQAVGFAGGAASGAAAGSVFGPWGTAIGAAVGGTIGLFSGKKARKAKKYQRMAQAVQKEREQNAADAQFLQMVREARYNRAGSLQAGISAGIETSSLATSALSSIGSQAGYNMNYFQNDRRLFALYSQYMERAGANLNTYQELSATVGILPDLTKGIKSASSLFLSEDKEVQPFNYNGQPVQV